MEGEEKPAVLGWVQLSELQFTGPFLSAFAQQYVLWDDPLENENTEETKFTSATIYKDMCHKARVHFSHSIIL